jgi:AcrR family transcriptional regulator
MQRARTQQTSSKLGDFVSRAAPPVPLSSAPLTARQHQLLDGIQAIVLREGFRRVRIVDLAERLKCSNGTLYQLARRKQDLLLLVIDRWYFNAGRRCWARVMDARTARDRAEGWLQAGIEEIRSVSAEFLEDVDSHVAIRQLVAAHNAYWIEVFGEIIEHGVETGEFRTPNPKLVAEVVEVALRRLQNPHVLQKIGASHGEAGSALADLLLNGVLRNGRGG